VPDILRIPAGAALLQAVVDLAVAVAADLAVSVAAAAAASAAAVQAGGGELGVLAVVCYLAIQQY
jgi:hypothetical protein